VRERMMRWLIYRKVLKQGHAIMYTDLSEREDDEMDDLGGDREQR
jgi:hypothetical protein